MRTRSSLAEKSAAARGRADPPPGAPLPANLLRPPWNEPAPPAAPEQVRRGPATNAPPPSDAHAIVVEPPWATRGPVFGAAAGRTPALPLLTQGGARGAHAGKGRRARPIATRTGRCNPTLPDEPSTLALPIDAGWTTSLPIPRPKAGCSWPASSMPSLAPWSAGHDGAHPGGAGGGHGDHGCAQPSAWPRSDPPQRPRIPRSPSQRSAGWMAAGSRPASLSSPPPWASSRHSTFAPVRLPDQRAATAENRHLPVRAASVPPARGPGVAAAGRSALPVGERETGTGVLPAAAPAVPEAVSEEVRPAGVAAQAPAWKAFPRSPGVPANVACCPPRAGRC